MSGFADKEQSRKRKSAVRTAIEGTAEEQIKGQENIETLEGGKYMPPAEEPKPSTEKKKAGRPKLQNRELRKRYSFTILPSLYEKAQEKAGNEGKTLSELITDFLTDYTK